MASSSTQVNGGITITKFIDHDASPQLAGAPVCLRKSNTSGCGCAVPGDPPAPNVGTNTVAESNRFPTATLAAGVYKS